jgi:hypothetical protein
VGDAVRPRAAPAPASDSGRPVAPDAVAAGAAEGGGDDGDEGGNGAGDGDGNGEGVIDGRADSPAEVGSRGPAPATSSGRVPASAAGSQTSHGELLAVLVDRVIGPEEAWVHSRWMHTQHARTSASARGLAAIGASCHRRCRSLLLDVCLFSLALEPNENVVSGLVDAFCRFAHRLLRAWEAELRMGAEDVAGLLSPAIERAWILGAPSYAPLAPLVSALLGGHMLQCFVPAFLEYNLAEERRLPPATTVLPLLTVPPLSHTALPIPLPPLVPPLAMAHAAVGGSGGGVAGSASAGDLDLDALLAEANIVADLLGTPEL